VELFHQVIEGGDVLPNREVFRLYDFSGGLNQVAHNMHLQDNETDYAQNVVFDELGALLKRKGYRNILENPISESEPIVGLYIFHEKDGTRHMLAYCGGTLYEIDEFHPLQEYQFSVLKDNLADVDYVGFTTWGGRCYITNGVDPIMEYDGDTIDEWDSSEKKGKFITAHKNQIFWAGNSDEPSELYYSEIAPPAGGPGDYGVITVQTDAGDEITNIIKQQDNLVIFKSNSIHVLYGSSEANFQMREEQPAIGCIAPKSVANVHNMLFFLFRDGVYGFDGTNVQLLSAKITPTIQDIVEPESCSAGWDTNYYYLAYTDRSGGDNDKVLAYHLLHESWTLFDNYPANMFNNYDGSQDGAINIGELYFGSSKDGSIFKVGIGYSDWEYDSEEEEYVENDIRVEYRTKPFNFGAPEIIKTFRNVLVDNLSIGSFNFNYIIDRGIYTGTLSIEGAEFEENTIWNENTWEELVWGGVPSQHSMPVRYILVCLAEIFDFILTKIAIKN